jgi:hypothetical protein
VLLRRSRAASASAFSHISVRKKVLLIREMGVAESKDQFRPMILAGAEMLNLQA